MNKKGFVFLETIAVVAILSASLVSMYSIAIKISSDIDTRKVYDNISDIYKTDIVRSDIKKDSIIKNEGYTLITKDNCTNYMSTECVLMIDELNVERILINHSFIGVIVLDNLNVPNTMKEYMKTLSGNDRYIIVNYMYNNKNYYASLEI